jgi:hypothetical protein
LIRSRSSLRGLWKSQRRSRARSRDRGEEAVMADSRVASATVRVVSPLDALGAMGRPTHLGQRKSQPGALPAPAASARFADAGRTERSSRPCAATGFQFGREAYARSARAGSGRYVPGGRAGGRLTLETCCACATRRRCHRRPRPRCRRERRGPRGGLRDRRGLRGNGPPVARSVTSRWRRGTARFVRALRSLLALQPARPLEMARCRIRDTWFCETPSAILDCVGSRSKRSHSASRLLTLSRTIRPDSQCAARQCERLSS